jgi:phosphoheptose isomerase
VTLLSHSEELVATLERLRTIEPAVEAAAQRIAACFRAGGKLLAAGNGGSAAQAQHLTGELVGRLTPDRERGALPAVVLHGDTSSLTAIGNDYGYEHVFARQVEALGEQGDMLLVLSTSGSSPNLVRAVDVARARGLGTIGLVGSTRRALHSACDHVLAVPSDSLAAIQECHLVLVHVIVERVEDLLSLAPQ